MESRVKRNESRMRSRWARMLEALRRTSAPTTEPSDSLITNIEPSMDTVFRTAPFLETRKSSSGLGDKSGFWVL